MTKSRNLIRKRKQWTPAEDALLLALYPCTRTGTIAKLFDCKSHQVSKRAKTVGVKKSQWFKRNSIMSGAFIDDNVGKAYRFQKGHVSHNKGKKCPSHPNSQKTQFKAGHKPVSWLPPGSTRIDSKDGYILIKMGEGTLKWRPLHRIIYQRMHGKVPAGDLVTFVDGNKLNISIINLTTISKKQHCINNSIQRYPTEIKQLYQIKGQITRQINKREREQS